MDKQQQRDIRSNLYNRTKKIRIRLLWRDNFKIFVTSRGSLYTVKYDELHAQGLHYNDLMAFIRLGPQAGMSISLCTLKQSNFVDGMYIATEVAPAFSRMQRRELQIYATQIAGYLVPCSSK